MHEREVKLGAGPAFHLPDLNGIVDGLTVTPPEAVRLETVYYDTPDLRLARWGVSLRYRAGEGWTLKLSPTTEQGMLERDEITMAGGPNKPPATALAPDPTPKHIRALGPRAMEPPEVAPVPVTAESPAREVIRTVLAESVAQILRNDPLVRTSKDPEAVHQARVATRKLRSHLRTFGPLLDPEWTDPLRSELGWLAMALGAVRDREVLLERLRERAKSLPSSDSRSAASLLHLLELEIESLRKKLYGELDSQRYVDLLESLVAAAHSPITTLDADQPASQVLPPLATGPWRRLRSAVRQLPEQPTDPELHRIRILAKRPRYAAEAVAPVVGEGAPAFARAAAKLQTILGEHQASVTAQAWLRAARVTGRRGVGAGELLPLWDRRAQQARRKRPKVWNSLDRKRLRKWMPMPGQ